MATTVPPTVTPTRTPLLEAVRNLAQARSREYAAKAALAEKRAAFDAENAALIAAEKEAKAAVTAAETTVRALAETDFNERHDKKPVPGVEIKLFKTLRYPADKALEWAKRTQMCLIPEQLDTEAFEKVAGATTLDFVEYGQDPRVQIAKDLEKALAVADVVQPAPEAAAAEDPFV